MSPKRPVDKLTDICLTQVASTLLEHLKCANVDHLRKYFGDVPQKLCDDILRSVTGTSTVTSYYKWLAYKVFENRASVLNCSNLSEKYQEDFVRRNYNLRHLNLRRASVEPGYLARALKMSTNLVSLEIPCIGTDEILHVVSKLKCLRFLDISGKSPYTPAGLMFLNNKTLEVLNIGLDLCPTIAKVDGAEIIGALLYQLPNLTQLRTYSYISKALLKCRKRTNLKSIIDTHSDSRSLSRIIELCPLLEALILVDHKCPEILNLLLEAKNLKTLKMRNVLQKNGNYSNSSLCLDCLDLDNFRVDATSLSVNLQTLRLIKCKLNESANLENLQVLEIIDCDLPKHIILSIMKDCKLLQRIAVSDDLGLTDDDLKRVCKNRNLKNLREFWLSRAKQLTSDSVLALMNHCDNLVLIGTLNGWKVEKVEVNYLRCVIYFTNTMLSLVYFGCF